MNSFEFFFSDFRPKQFQELFRYTPNFKTITLSPMVSLELLSYKCAHLPCCLGEEGVCNFFLNILEK